MQLFNVLGYLSESKGILTVVRDCGRIPVVLDGILHVVQIMFDHNVTFRLFCAKFAHYFHNFAICRLHTFAYG